VLQCTRQAPPRCIGMFKIMEEREEELKTRFQVSFLIRLNLGDMIYFKGGGGRFVTPQNSKILECD
jgi:hypothetical protein